MFHLKGNNLIVKRQTHIYKIIQTPSILQFSNNNFCTCRCTLDKADLHRYASTIQHHFTLTANVSGIYFGFYNKSG